MHYTVEASNAVEQLAGANKRSLGARLTAQGATLRCRAVRDFRCIALDRLRLATMRLSPHRDKPPR